MCVYVCGHILIHLVHRVSVVGMGGPSWHASVKHICRMQVVTMVRMMMGADVIFLAVICYQLHSALSLQKEINKKTYNA